MAGGPVLVMEGKYASAGQYWLTKLRRAALRAILRPLLSWKSLADPEPGYSAIIGCASGLAPLLLTNLRMLSRQQAPNLRKVLAVWDRPPTPQIEQVQAQARREYGQLPLEFLHYTPTQAAVLAAVGWGWCYSWLSWSIGIAAARTRYALLHDFDAMLIRPDILEERYEAIRQRRDQYVGIRNYLGNGVYECDGLVTTFELIFDVSFVRERFRPIDLFNHVTIYKGRRVDFDTFLYAQSRAGRSSVLPIAVADMVHPSQMVCQYTDYVNRRGYVPPEHNNLLMIPYFLSLSGEDETMEDLCRQLESAGQSALKWLGRRLDVSRLTPVHARWITEQAARLERAVFGEVRPQVVRYCSAVEKHVLQSAAAAADGRLAEGS